MQKKIMLALIVSSNGFIICQQPPTTAAPTFPTSAAPLTPSVAAPATTPVAPAPAPITNATATTALIPAPAQMPPATTTPSGATPPLQIPPQVQPTVTQPTVIQPAIVVPAQAPQKPITPTTAAATQAAVAPTQAPAPATTEQPPAQPAAPAPTEELTVSEPMQQPQVAPQEFKPQPEEPEEELEIKGIDTVDINEAKGNWLYKRIWWEKAERTYEKIKQLTDKILDSRMNFFVKRNELDRMIVEFYSDLGFKQGELTELISFMTRQLEQERREEGSLDEKERELLNTLTQEKKNIEQLQQGTQNISKIDRALEDALMKLVEQLNQAKYYEQQAWEHFKAINRELSDKKARELFYSMDTYWRNLNSINSYLSDAFAKYFDQLSQKIQQETDKIKTNVQALSEKGISLQVQALAMKKECKIPTKEEAEVEQPEAAPGFVGSVWGWIKSPFVAVGNAVGGLIGWVTGLFDGAETEEVTLAKPARSVAAQASEPEEEPS